MLTTIGRWLTGRGRVGVKSLLVLMLVFLGTGGIATLNTSPLRASDHDDGEVDTKGRNVSLTDLYVFRDSDQNPSASSEDLVLIMNTNPRSLPRQQYYFSNRARYEFHISRMPNVDAAATGKADTTIRFEFDAPRADRSQPFKMTIVTDRGNHVTTGITTPIGSQPNVQQTRMGNNFQVSIFAGLREDPFFFDVEQFFRVRAGAAGFGPAVGFRTPDRAVDFASGYNVNAIAVRVPIKLLQGNTNAKVFDVWETISIAGQGRDFQQVERLARPGINEGLIISNNLLNTLNSIGPDFEAAALAGKQPQARAAAPVIAEASETLKALGNDSTRTSALLQAFLPDVMRIDTTAASGYGNALNAKGSPVRGRLLKDDVIDITLSVLSNGAIKSDNVSYEGTPGNPAQGHQPLVTSFPYLAPAN